MYWCSWGDLHKIEMAGMDGSHRHILASDSLKNPTGLAIDLENSRLYWANVGLKTIEFTNLDGTRKQTLIGKLKRVILKINKWKLNKKYVDTALHHLKVMLNKHLICVDVLLEIQFYHY
jgi:Low-density lipoprotein receptor repeat class B.